MSQQLARPVAAILIAAFVLIGVPSGAYAQSANVGHASRAASPVKRTVWTIVGAAAGFGLGTWFGLHKFDDATNSDRKVWISAITGAAIGGIAGVTLSRDIKPAFGRDRRPRLDAPLPVPRLAGGPHDSLASRVRAANAREFELR